MTTTCGRSLRIVRHNETGEIISARNHCRQWSCKRCAPVLAAETQDRLYPQVIQHEMRYLSTLTLPPSERNIPLPNQAKLLKQLITRVIDKMAYICSPDIDTYKKRASRSKTAQSKSTAQWEQRFIRRILLERAEAIEYDTYMSQWVIAQYVLRRQKWFHRQTPERKQQYAVELWQRFIRNEIRMAKQRNIIQEDYDRAIQRMTISSGLPTYYAAYELHDAKDAVHVHMLSDIWLGHYAWHSILFKKREITRRLRAFRRHEFVELPHDWIYQSLEIGQKKHKQRHQRTLDADVFALDTSIDYEPEEDQDMLQAAKYIMKTLNYITDDLADTMSFIAITKPDFHSANLVIRPGRRDNDDSDGKYKVLKGTVPFDLPMASLVLRDVTLSTTDDWMLSILREIDKYKVNYDTVYHHDNVNSHVSMTELFFPLGANERYAELVAKLSDGEQLSPKERKAFRRLDQQYRSDVGNFRITLLIARLLDHFTAKQMNVPDLSNTMLHMNQRMAIKAVAQNPVTIITGAAGTGKSLVITELCRELQLNPAQTLIITKLGKAAALLNAMFVRNGLPYRAMTVHMALRASRLGKFALNEFHTLAMYDTVIVDEVGMVEK